MDRADSRHATYYDRSPGMNINLHIEQLILDGLPLAPGQGTALQVALEGELTRLLTERGVGSLTGGAVPQLSMSSIQLAPGSPPDQWGRQIAHSLCQGLAPVSSAGLRQAPNHQSHFTAGAAPAPLS